MGISWSNRRRNNHHHNHYLPQPPPPLPPPLPPYHEPTLYPTTNQPPPPPPGPPPYHPPHTPYVAPPPMNSYHYNSHAYTRGYGNTMMGRFNYQFHYQPPYYANQAQPQAHCWPANRTQVGPPPPYVDHQSAKKVRNDVNVHKDTLKIEVDGQNPDHFLLSFVFDAMFDGSITILYFAEEGPNCRFAPLFPEASMPVKIPFKKGLGQKFCQPSGTGIDLGFFELDDLSKPSPGEDIFPLVISAETYSTSAETYSTSTSTNGYLSDPEQNTVAHMQITQAVLEKNNDASFQAKVIKQILWVDGVRYELQEIYGIGSSAANGFDDSDPGKECVICMTEPKDTAVLPCRHMCMCSECAKALRLQSNKCPICRQPIQELMEIKINSGNR